MLKFDGLFLFDRLFSKRVDHSFRQVGVEEAFEVLKTAFPKATLSIDDHGTSLKIRSFVDNGFLSVGVRDGFEQVVYSRDNQWFFVSIPKKDYPSKVAYRLSKR